MSTTGFTPLPQAARRLGLPMAWLKSEAEANRIPHIRVGRRIFVSLEQLQSELQRRAAEQTAHGAETPLDQYGVHN